MRTKQQITEVFNLISSGYDNPAMRFFPFCADRLVAKLDLRPGQKLLDAATGTGTLAVAAAQRLNPGGRVTAIDIADNMLDQAQKNIDKMSLTNIDIHKMDAESLEFRSNYFDVVACSFGLFFLSDMVAGLKGWLRVCRPGGRIVFTSFGDEAFQPMLDSFRNTLEQYGVNAEQEDRPYGIELLTDAGRCKELAKEAGLQDCCVETAQLGYHLKGADEWWEVVWNSGLRGSLVQFSAERLEQFKREHLADVGKFATDQGIWLNIQIHFTSGTKPQS